MDYQALLTTSFRHSIKRLEKRFRHVKDDVRTAIRQLQQNPRQGTLIPGGFGARKVRVLNTDLGKGKSGGYRLIYYVEDLPTPIIYLLLLYAKSDRDDVTRSELKRLLDELINEMRE